MSENRYYVEAETKPGTLVNVYDGNNRNRAVEVTNFWDERVNTYFHDRAAEQAAEETRIAALPFEDRLDILLDKMVAEAYARLDAQVEAGNRRQEVRAFWFLAEPGNNSFAEAVTSGYPNREVRLI